MDASALTLFISPSLICSSAHLCSKQLKRGISHRRNLLIPIVSSQASPREDAAAEVPLKLDRRELLLAGGAAASLIANPHPAALAAPAGDPDLKTCSTVIIPKTLTSAACCPPKAKRAAIQFKPDSGPLRIRRPAHLIDDAYIAKYNDAYAKMRALPSDDPRSLFQQANVHCAYCNYGYRQQGDPESKLQIHFSWLFLPWHRYYLYFHEKILGHLIGDPTFAIPFWNWDNQSGDGGNLIPDYFLRKDSALFDENRNPAHYPPAPVNLANYPGDDADLRNETDPDKIKKVNLSVMANNVGDVRDTQTFGGGPYRRGDSVPANSNAGTLENAPHTAIHIWGGNPANPNNEDLGNFYSAGKDPLFYSHHSNVDRMWDVWRSLGNSDFTDPDYLSTEFLFFDQNQDLVRCKVKDVLDLDNTRTSYQKMLEDQEWIDYQPPLAKPVRRTSLVSTFPFGTQAADAAEKYPELDGVVGAVVKEKPLTIAVAQGRGPEDLATKGDEILVLTGVEFPIAANTTFEVYLDYPEANQSTRPDCAEYVGSFNNFPGMMSMDMKGPSVRTTDVRFTIRKNVQFLGLRDASSLLITLVPKGDAKAEGFRVKGAKIIYTP